MINIVIPMAGLGSRFSNAGYELPKPLIPVHGIPMIRLVIDNVRPASEHRFIFICQRAHLQEFSLSEKLKSWAGDCHIVELDGLTQGAACTVLSAAGMVDTDDPLLIVNSDQYVEASIDEYLNAACNSSVDGLIMTMTAHDPKWSFVEIGADGLVNRVVEKEMISDCATVGIYHFRQGRTFVAAAKAMISKDIRVNGEFYVAPVYNEMISDGAAIKCFDIGSVASGMYGLGTPADLDHFLTLPISSIIASRISGCA